MKENKDIKRYDDIINMPHHTSAVRPHMSNYDRAAQFSPFAALTGHDAAVKETARLTEEKQELDDYEKARLNDKLQIIADRLPSNPMVTITYFSPDEQKSGGAYRVCSGCVKKIDGQGHTVVMTDKKVIPIQQISEIEGDLFRELESFD